MRHDKKALRAKSLKFMAFIRATFFYCASCMVGRLGAFEHIKRDFSLKLNEWRSGIRVNSSHLMVLIASTKGSKGKCDDAIKDNMLHFYESHNSRVRSIKNFCSCRDAATWKQLSFMFRVEIMRFINNLLIAQQKNFPFALQTLTNSRVIFLCKWIVINKAL